MAILIHIFTVFCTEFSQFILTQNDKKNYLFYFTIGSISANTKNFVQLVVCHFLFNVKRRKKSLLKIFVLETNKQFGDSIHRHTRLFDSLTFVSTIRSAVKMFNVCQMTLCQMFNKEKSFTNKIFYCHMNATIALHFTCRFFAFSFNFIVKLYCLCQNIFVIT